MRFGVFTAQYSPISIDFGSSSVKLLQITSGEKPEVVEAVEIEIPDALRREATALPAFLEERLPQVLSKAKFRGKRAVCTMPSANTLIQHMQLSMSDGMKSADLVRTELQIQMGCSPDKIVVRTIDVTDIHRQGQNRKEVICFAIARDAVMRNIAMLKRCKLDVVGVHTETVAMVRAFDHISRRTEDVAVSTLFVDLGWGGTRVAITHGRNIVFARYIQLGGVNFDQHIANTLHCDLATARAHRLALASQEAGPSASARTAVSSDGMAILSNALNQGAVDGTAAQVQSSEADSATTTDERRGDGVPTTLARELEGGVAPAQVANVDQTELLDTITDELSMCLRYHRGLFPDRSINRVIFVGGEARQEWLCQNIVRKLRLPARMGDPLARLKRPTGGGSTIDFDQPQPGWAVPCGLCTAPTDL